ncbi:polynucleotide adenylyltransferase PcnB [bacterium]|nr:polynucleotide adenylyltransferase PcnB [bacterium]
MTTNHAPDDKPQATTQEPVIITRSDHPISRKKIAQNAVKILYRLKNRGFTAYLAGGAVRDMLLGDTPADFDIVTDATPKQIKRLFRNSRIIGRRFRLVHIFFHDRSNSIPQIYEIATFRRPFTQEQDDAERIKDEPELANNLFGTPKEDASRRDFTVNALFYNIADFSVIDHVYGLNDLKNRIIRIIGDPNTRFAEDPVRILRALEFACRLKFTIEEETVKGLKAQAEALSDVPPSRLREELKGLYTKKATSGLLELGNHYQINQHWLPLEIAASCLDSIPIIKQIENFFPTTDNSKELEKMVVAALIMPNIIEKFPLHDNLRLGLVREFVEESLKPINQRFNLPRFQRHAIKDIFTLLYRLSRGDKRVNKLVSRDHFFSALFLYATINHQAPSKPDHFSFWQRQCDSLNRNPQAQGLDYSRLFLED